jgi:hypothetical protein
MRHFHLLCAALCFLSLGLQAAESVLFTADFERDPLPAGWSVVGKAGEVGAPAWVETPAPSGTHALTATTGYWQSPHFPVTPGQFYQLEVATRGDGPGYWHAWFYTIDPAKPEEENGSKDVLSGVCSQLEVTEGWGRYVTCFQTDRGRPFTHCRLAFQPLKGKAIFLDDLTVRPIDHPRVAAWADRVYATVPRLPLKLPAERWHNLPKTRRALQRRTPLRVVMLGDSNVNDIYSSWYQTLVARRYRHPQLEVFVAVEGGGGGKRYTDPAKLKELVLDRRPDLLIFGGISNGNALDSIRSIIAQVRAGCGAEILLMSGTYPPLDPATKGPWKTAIDPTATDYRSRLFALAQAEKTGFVDIAAPMSQYLAASGHEPLWFYRDTHHFNDRGKQIFARILETFFNPE